MCSNRRADQRLCFHLTDSPILPLRKSVISSANINLLWLCADRFVSDLVENPENWFSHLVAHITDDRNAMNTQTNDPLCSPQGTI